MTISQRWKTAFVIAISVWVSMFLVFPKEVVGAIFNQLKETMPYWPIFVAVVIVVVIVFVPFALWYENTTTDVSIECPE